MLILWCILLPNLSHRSWYTYMDNGYIYTLFLSTYGITDPYALNLGKTTNKEIWYNKIKWVFHTLNYLRTTPYLSDILLSLTLILGFSASALATIDVFGYLRTLWPYLNRRQWRPKAVTISLLLTDLAHVCRQRHGTRSTAKRKKSF